MDYVDDDGYPSEKALDIIKKWDDKDIKGLKENNTLKKKMNVFYTIKML